MSTQFNDYGEIIQRDQYGDVPTVGGYAIESGAEQMGLFSNGKKPMVSVRGYRVPGYNVAAYKRRPRRARESGNAQNWTDPDYDLGLEIQILAAEAKQELELSILKAKASKDPFGPEAIELSNKLHGGGATKSELLKLKAEIDDEIAIEDAIDKLTEKQLVKIYGTSSKKEAKKKAVAKKRAEQKRTVLAGVSPRASYAWIPWTIGVLALAYWFTRPERG